MTRDIHYRYIIGILVALIIEIIALSFSDQQDLVDKFNFAATLSSLLLALVAILYSVTSALKQEMQITRLSDTNFDIRSAAMELRTLAEGISSFAKDAPKQFESIANKLDTMRGGFTNIDGDGNDLADDDDAAPLEYSESQFREVFFGLQMGAMAALYFFWRASRRSVAFSATEFEKATLGSFEYGIGVYTALEACGLIKFSYHKKEVIPVETSRAVNENVKYCLELITKDAETDFARGLAKRTSAIDEFFDPPVAQLEPAAT